MADPIICSREIQAPPEAVFAHITDIEGLPSWNDRINEVVDKPRNLAEGAAWTVCVKANGATWNSHSEVLELDPTQHRFVHRSKREGNNPSYALWTWTVHLSETGSEVTVTCEPHPKTFLLKCLLLPIRKGPLRKEMQASLNKLAESVPA